MLRVNNLVKTFDGFTALNGVNMHVPKGAVYALVGPNGAGKTTLLLNIADVQIPDSGEVFINGIPVRDNALAKQGTVMIPDEVFYYPQSTLLSLMRLYSGIYPQFDEGLFRSLQSVFSELNVRMPVRRLSKGMKKQAAFWLAISCRPELLILDEPVDGLDPAMRRSVWKLLMNEIARTDMTVLVSSHNLREMEGVCDHIGILNRGRMILEASTDELQGSVFKIQTAFEHGFPVPEGTLNILQMQTNGKITELIVRGSREKALAALQNYHPLLCESMPLTLEEIFLYEIGGKDDEIAQLLL